MVRSEHGVEKISVIVATYNRAAYLRLCLACLLAQDYTGRWEIVVADDGSTDGTRDVVDAARRQRPDVPIEHVWREHAAYRRAFILNEGVRHSNGDLLVFMDSDTAPGLSMLGTYATHAAPRRFYLGGAVGLTERFTLAALDGAAPPDPAAFIAQAALAANQESASRRKLRARYWKSRLYQLVRLGRPRIRGNNFAVNREVYEAINGMDENFVGYGQEDSDLRDRLIRSGARPAALHLEALAYHLWHPANLEARREAAGNGNNRPYYYRPNVEVVCRNGLRRLGPAAEAAPAPCLVCGAEPPAPAFARDGLDYFRCACCGLLYIDHLRAPAAQANRELYGDRRSEYLDDPDHRRKHERRARRVLQGFAARGFKGRLLEVGCAEGLFLSVARDEGWDVHGVELEPGAADRGRREWGLDIHGGPIDTAPWPEESFHVAYLSNVLEHLLDPLGVLRAVHRLLRPGGLVHVKTGNVDSYCYRALGPDWYYLDFVAKGHVAFYSPKTVALALERAGFARRRIRIRTTGIHACRRPPPWWRPLWYTLLGPWAHLTRQGDTLRAEALRSKG